ncbi:hypothetical protein B2A_12742 [mine drainage metagenome]|uniref:DUF4160 domain-containing protein n=1 Tax=mine drainage metagenome TaxID=410659 RepID=T0YGM7_9ZZZZ
MPTLRELLGILIRMSWDDHPPPHFHALYGEHEAQYNIASLDIINGSLPRRAHALVCSRLIAQRGTDEELG